MIYLNDKHFYLEQLFKVSDKIYAESITQGLLRGKNGHMSPQEVFNQMGKDFRIHSPPDKLKFVIVHAI